MREEIPLKKLGEVCHIIGGGTPSKKKEEYYNGLIPWATVRDMNYDVLEQTDHSITEIGLKNSSANVIPKNNVVIATRVGLGKVCILEQDTAINQDLKGIIPKSDFLLTKYLFLWFKSISNQIINAGTGATVQGVKIPFVKNLKIPIPPLPVQKRIMEILDEAFEAIDQVKANVERNIQNAEELFQSKLNEIYSSNADLAEDWDLKRWNEVLEIRSGRSQKEVVNPEGPYPIYGSGGSIMGYADDYICEEGTTIIGRKGTIDNPLFIETKFWNVDTAFGLIAGDALDKRYLYYFCLSFDFKSRDKGTTLPSLVKKDLINIKIPIPPLPEQERIVIELDKVSQMKIRLISVFQKQLNNIEELKKSILQKAFSGELTANEHVAV